MRTPPPPPQTNKKKWETHVLFTWMFSHGGPCRKGMETSGVETWVLFSGTVRQMIPLSAGSSVGFSESVSSGGHVGKGISYHSDTLVNEILPWARCSPQPDASLNQILPSARCSLQPHSAFWWCGLLHHDVWKRGLLKIIWNFSIKTSWVSESKGVCITIKECI